MRAVTSGAGRRRFRGAILLVHQYAGFIFAAYLIVVCLSGAALILLENQIDGFRDYPMERVPVRGQRVPLSQMIRSVERANPGLTVYHLLASCPAGCTYDASMHQGGDRLDALVDPYTGTIVRTVVWQRTPVGILDDLHGSLMSGDTGAEVNAVAGLSLIVLSLTGLYLWPGWRSLRLGFTINRRSGAYRISYDLHKVLGILSMSFLVMWALTGAGQVLWAEPPEPIAPVRHRGNSALGFDGLVRAGDAALPGRMTMAYTAANGVVVVRKQVPGDPDPYGYSYVAVDRYTGRVTQVYDIRTFSPMWRLRTMLYAIHIGSPGGLVLRWTYAVVGTIPAISFATAFLMWLYKLRRSQ
ncbi:MAG TPA: PepSY-associated TM helix domain-containing protein [Verrucomicrobiae bacterium]|nr:PepSY-associated TM helix domain-containing protein [Verrucomicrobiae bacterium]